MGRFAHGRAGAGLAALVMCLAVTGAAPASGDDGPGVRADGGLPLPIHVTSLRLKDMPLPERLVSRGRDVQDAAVTAGVRSPHPPLDDAARRGRRNEADDRTISIVLAGDTGFNRDRQRPRPDGVRKHGNWLSWDETTRHVLEDINGDLNFANVETVVSARRDLRASPKAFNFVSHPNAFAHLVGLGFNVFSLANNHAGDYGRSGVRETLANMEALRTAGLLGHAGIGLNRAEAARPDVFDVSGKRFAFSAMGIGSVALAGETTPGQLNIHDDATFDGVTRQLAGTAADYRILSLHYGLELNTRPSASQVRRWRDETAIGKGIDLIVGHHAHVAQGIQRVDGRLIFYGLGNFLHHGTRDMGPLDSCRDYGLLARVYLTEEAGQLKPSAVQVIPLQAMHMQPKRMSVRQAHRRIALLNGLARELDDAATGARGVMFEPQPDGTGLACLSPLAEGISAIGAACTRMAAGVGPGRSEHISNACGRSKPRRSRGRRIVRHRKSNRVRTSTFRPFSSGR